MVEVPETYTGEGVIRKIEIVGKALGLDDKAKILADNIAQDIEAAKKPLPTETRARASSSSCRLQVVA